MQPVASSPGVLQKSESKMSALLLLPSLPSLILLLSCPKSATGIADGPTPATCNFSVLRHARYMNAA